MFLRRPLWIAVLSLCFAFLASADLYNITIDTSTISGTAGSLDFNFNPGPLVTQAASLQIQSFSSDGSLAGSPSLIGDVSGTLPATLNLDNGAGFNDYFEGFTFGSLLSFNISLDGPAITSPDGVSTSAAHLRSACFQMRQVPSRS